MNIEELKSRLRKDREQAYERRLEEKNKRKADRKLKPSTSHGAFTELTVKSAKMSQVIGQKTSESVAGTSQPISQETPKSLQKSPVIFQKTPKIRIKDKGKKKCKQGTKRAVNKEREKATERKRKQRERIMNNPERHATEKEKERLRSARRRAEGKIKKVAQMKPRELKTQRKKWRQAKQRQQSKEKIEKQTQELIELTPPNSPSIEQVIVNRSDRRRANGRKKVKTNRAKAYRRVNELENENKRLSTLLEKWKKRCKRSKEKKETTAEPSSISTPSPGIKVRRIIRSGAEEVKKHLYLGEILNQEIQKKVSDNNSQKEKRELVKYLNKDKLKRHRCFSTATSMASRYLINRHRNIVYIRHRRNNSMYLQHMKLIKKFLEDDSNSCILPGKRDTITKGKVKKQKRYLLDTLANLHKKFIGTVKKCSYAQFCKLKPFWFVRQDTSKRDTCLCKKCTNMKFLIQKLNIHKVSNCKIFEVPKFQCCDERKYECMYGICPNCPDKALYNPEVKANATKTFYHQWLNRKETRIGKGNATFTVNIVVKGKIYCTIQELFKEVNNQMPNYPKHRYNIFHQQTSFNELKANLTTTEGILIVDFSENYNCKYQSEIQSAHFGASKPQITLHTGIFYYKNTAGKIQKNSFCSISSSLEHNPSAIWAHLKTILNFIKRDHPGINVLHFRSDGPVTQYRNRKHFFLLSKILPSYNIDLASWTFSEAGHGKSAADGVGGLMKRTADRFVSHGNDIVNTAQFIKAVQDLKVLRFEVTDSDIRQIDDLLSPEIPAIPRTLSIHEMVWHIDEQNMFETRNLTCTNCKFNKDCFHFGNTKNSWKISTHINLEHEENVVIQRNEISDVKTTEIPREMPNTEDYVAVAFEDDWYPGRILEIEGSILKIKFMQRKGDNKFSWPTVQDIQNIPSDEILFKFPEAPLSSNRFFSFNNYHKVNEMFK